MTRYEELKHGHKNPDIEPATGLKIAAEPQETDWTIQNTDHTEADSEQTHDLEKLQTDDDPQWVKNIDKKFLDEAGNSTKF